MTGDDGVPHIDDWNRLLDGRVAVVTGGGDGIGAGISRLFAQHGALVEVAEIDQERADRIRDEVAARADASAATSSTSPSTTTSPAWPRPC